MQSLHISRYSEPTAGYLGNIVPQDRSWILFIPVHGDPQLYIRTTCTDENGDTFENYVGDWELKRLVALATPGVLPDLPGFPVGDSSNGKT